MKFSYLPQQIFILFFENENSFSQAIIVHRLNKTKYYN